MHSPGTVGSKLRLLQKPFDPKFPFNFLKLEAEGEINVGSVRYTYF